MDEETMSKETQLYFDIIFLGKRVTIMGMKDGRYQVIYWCYEYEGKRYHFEDSSEDK